MKPPTISVPEDTTVEVGETFDELAGVTASDEADGDLTAEIDVVGEVDTDTAGSYALTYVVGDRNGNQAIATRVVRVVEVADTRSATSVTVGNASVTFGQQATLSARVTPATATGLVRFLNGEEVLCEAMAANGTASCTVATLPPPGDYVVVASYVGDEAHQESQRSFVLRVADAAVAAKADPRLRAKVARASLARGVKVVLKAKVSPGATGQVVFRAGGRTLCVAAVTNGVATCRVRLAPGTWKVRAAYAGSAAYAADKAVVSFRKR